MKATFLGVGEACDERYPNTSLLLQGVGPEARGKLLLDCGFTVPPLVWEHLRGPEDLEGLWLSHFHGDHFFGVPLLLLRLWEMERKRPLAIFGQEGVQAMVEQTMDLAYPGFRQKLGYPLEFHAVEPGQIHSFLACRWRTAATEHGRRCLALRLECQGASLFYSGDGRPTEATLELARGCDLLVHEAFAVDSQKIAGHGTVTGCLALARAAKARCLAVVHMQRDQRREKLAQARDLLAAVSDFHAFAPEPGDQIDLGEKELV